MNKEVLEWITKNCLVRRFSEKATQQFLEMLKKEPEKIVDWVAGELMEWCMVACLATKKPIVGGNPREDALLVVEHFKEHFAKELASIPA